MSTSFLDNSRDIVVRALRGAVRRSPNLALDPDDKIVFRRDLQYGSTLDKVILLSGGGSGHEPAHAGYVGEGMLDVAVVGNVFASPSASQIFKAIKAFSSNQGMLIITKNYTGDVLSFGLAVEKAKTLGLKCKLLIVGDDIAIPYRQGSTVGRRGLAGTVLVQKIAGAAVSSGSSLDEVYEIAKRVADSLATIGVSLDRCHVPGRQVDDKGKIGAGEVEYGMGIHNEPGVQRAPLKSLEQTVEQLLHRILNAHQSGRTFIKFDKHDDIALAINNLGGLSVLEMHVILDETVTQLYSTYSISPSRTLVGTFISSMNGPGFSITLLKMSSDMKTLLDRTTQAFGWVPASRLNDVVVSSAVQHCPVEMASKANCMSVNPTTFERILLYISKGIITDEPRITYFDTISGDGDCGETLLAGSNAILDALTHGQIDTSDIIAGLHTITILIEKNMGGTSGAIYSIYLNALVKSLDAIVRKSLITESSSIAKANVIDITTAGVAALAELYKYTKARTGDRTMMDVLIPFIETLSSGPDQLDEALSAALNGADSTKRMKASFGRASYVDETVLARHGSVDGEKDGIPDAGALGLLSILKAIVTAVSEGD